MLFSDATHDDVDVAWNSTAALFDGGQNDVEIDGDGFQDVIDAINLLHDHDGDEQPPSQPQQDVQSTDKRRQIIMSSLFVSLMICYVAFCFYYNRRGKSRSGGGSDGSNHNGNGSGNNPRDSQSRQRRRADVQSVLDESSSAVHRARQNAEEQRKLKERKEKIKESLFLRLVVEEEHYCESEGEKDEAIGRTDRGEEEKEEETEEELEPKMELAEGMRGQTQTEENLMEEGMANTIDVKDSEALDGNDNDDDDEKKQTAMLPTSPAMDSDKNTSSAITSPSSSMSFLSSFSSRSKSTSTTPAASTTSPSSEGATPAPSAAAPQCPTSPTCTNFKRYTDALQASLHSCQSRHGSTIDCSNNGSISCNYYSNNGNNNGNNSNHNNRNQPTISISAMIHTQGEECNICLSTFQVGDRAAWTKKGGCVHAFHEECISKWLLVREDCPMCRRSFLLEERESGDGDGGEEDNIQIVDAENADSSIVEEGNGMDVGGNNVTGAAVRDLEHGWGVAGIVAVEEEEEEEEEEGHEEALAAATASAPATMIKASSQ